jgi:hypothetical protein
MVWDFQNVIFIFNYHLLDKILESELLSVNGAFDRRRTIFKITTLAKIDAALINHRPHKSLNYRTPSTYFSYSSQNLLHFILELAFF